MQVKEIMTCGVECVSPDTTLQEAANKMKERDVGPLPVCDGNRLVGMITDRDITVRSVAHGYDPWTDKVQDAMTPWVIYCYEDEDVTAAARSMEEKQVRRLVVLDREKRLVGIVSLGDLAAKDREGKLGAEALEQGAEPAAPRR